MLTDYFDRIYYINLDSRLDRKTKFLELNSQFLDLKKVTRISAVDIRNTLSVNHYNGIMGARTGIGLSFIKAIKDAVNNGFKKIIIFEDDAEPLFSNEREIVDSVLSAEKREASMLFFGGTILSKVEKNGDLFILDGNILATHAVAYWDRDGLFSRLIQEFPDTIDGMFNHLVNKGSVAHDTIIGTELTKEFKTFLPSRLLYGQYASFSNINAQEESYNEDMQKRFKEFTKC